MILHQKSVKGFGAHTHGRGFASLFFYPFSDIFIIFSVHPYHLQRGDLLQKFNSQRFNLLIKDLLPLFTAADASLQAIVFQMVRLIYRQGGQTAAQIAEHLLVGKITDTDLQSTADGLCQGIGHHGTGPVHI